MKPTVICKRIENGEPDGGQDAYARNLLSYMATCEKKGADEDRKEKCVAFIGRNFHKPVVTAEEAAMEMGADCLLSARLKQGIDHWVMSWGPGERPSCDEIFKAVTSWIREMGYSDHKWAAAIHADTDNIHCHIALCRVNPLTGAVKKRQWWKKDNQKALAVVAHERGWKLEAGARYRVEPGAVEEVVVEDCVTGEKRVEKRPMVVETGKKSDFCPGDRVSRHETYNGIKSDKRAFHERMKRAYDSMKDELPKMKWGQIHKRLAGYGIEMRRVKHGDRYGLLYSLDGENWHSGSDVCREMTWKELNGHIGAEENSWRDARTEKLKPILEEARALDWGSEAGPLWGLWGQKYAIDAGSDKPVVRKIDFRLLPVSGKRKIIPVTREVAEKLRAKGFKVVTIPAKEWEAAAREMHKNIQEKPELASNFLKWIDKENTKSLEAKTAPENLKSEAVSPSKKAEAEAAREFTKGEIESLRQLPMDKVREKLKAVGIKLKKGKKPSRNAIDVLVLEAGKPYAEAVKILAEMFPESLGKDNALKDSEAYREACDAAKEKAKKEEKEYTEFESGSPGHLAGMELTRWWRALSLESVYVHTQSESGDVWGYNKKADLAGLLLDMPKLVKIASTGNPVSRTSFYCSPQWREGKAGIILHGPRMDFLKKYPPSAVCDAVGRSRQAFWTIDRKHKEPAFYDWFARELNKKHGDLKAMEDGVPLPGFVNWKRPMPGGSLGEGGMEGQPIARLVFRSNAKPKEMERLADEWRPKWEAEALTDRAPSDGKSFEETLRGFRKTALPDWIRETGLQLREYYSMLLGPADWPRIDSMTAKSLFQIGATGDEVYSFILSYSALGVRGNAGLSVEMAREKDRHARRLVSRKGDTALAGTNFGGLSLVRARDQESGHKTAHIPELLMDTEEFRESFLKFLDTDSGEQRKILERD